MPDADRGYLFRACGLAVIGWAGSAVDSPRAVQGSSDEGRDPLRPEALLAVPRFGTLGFPSTFMGSPHRGRMNSSADYRAEKSATFPGICFSGAKRGKSASDRV